jgi:IS30 family transposase
LRTIGTRLGDWEGDTVVSAGHKGGLLTLVERKTQLAKITKLPRATARATQKAAVRRLQPIGYFVRTITFDNGKEFAGASRHPACTENQNLLRHAVSCIGARVK